MKRLITAMFLVAYSYGNLYAQEQSAEAPEVTDAAAKSSKEWGVKGWYLTVQGGYMSPFFTSNRRSPFPEIGDRNYYEYLRNNTNVVRDQSVKGIISTYGKGFDAGISAGYMFNKNFGLDVTFLYANYPKEMDAQIITDSYKASQFTGGKSFNFSPAIHMRFVKKRIGLYNKIGLIFPIYTKLKSDVSIIDREGRFISGMFDFPFTSFPEGLTETVIEGKATTTLKSSIGLKGALGIEIFISDRASFIAEANASLNNIKIKETIFDEQYIKVSAAGLLPIAEYTNIDEVPEYLKHYVWVDEITEDSNNGRYGNKYDLNKPQEEVGLKFNISSIYMNLGFKFNLGKASDPKNN